mgnify:CR=1 FL=1
MVLREMVPRERSNALWPVRKCFVCWRLRSRNHILPVSLYRVVCIVSFPAHRPDFFAQRKNRAREGGKLKGVFVFCFSCGLFSRRSFRADRAVRLAGRVFGLQRARPGGNRCTFLSGWALNATSLAQGGLVNQGSAAPGCLKPSPGQRKSA